jgi:glyoxylase I family protein
VLSLWYRENLGINLVPENYEQTPWQQQAGPTVFAPFPTNTDYFGNPDRQWMINFRVSDLDAMVEQLSAKGVAVEIDPNTYPSGRFARTHDPEGHAIELWQPTGRDA